MNNVKRDTNSSNVTLTQYIAKKKEIIYLKDKIDSIREQLDCIKSSSDTSLVPAQPFNDDKLADIIANLVDLENYYDSELTKLLHDQLDVERTLTVLEPIERLVIRYKYFEGMQTDEIADKVNYSYAHTKRIIKRAIQKL